MDIKFRAYNVRERKMLFNVEHTYDYGCISGSVMEESFGVVLDDNDYIVMQYIGRLDKNDICIYEGDLIYNHLTKKVHEVKWDNDTSSFILVCGEYSIPFHVDGIYEVVGNKYEK